MKTLEELIEELNELKCKLNTDTNRLIAAQKDVDKDVICIDKATELIRQKALETKNLPDRELQVQCIGKVKPLKKRRVKNYVR